MEKADRSLSSRNAGMYKLITIISIIIPLVVAVLLFMPAKLDLAREWVYFLPHLNAVINCQFSIGGRTYIYQK